MLCYITTKLRPTFHQLQSRFDFKNSINEARKGRKEGRQMRNKFKIRE